MSNGIELQLSELANGAIQEKLDGELKKLFNNIQDPNTDAEAKRGLTIKLEFKPDEKRQVVALKSDITLKLTPVTGVLTTVLTGRDLNTGQIEARELKSEVPGQTYIDIDDGKQKTDTGRPVEELEQSNQIIDLQKRG
ncbi:replication terminator protein [Melissococcus plutonius]|uniref:replication terminator protein n=1 Tax=Melissococcus plutonius TaxID=33970 RepID=UPI0021E622C8|nr:replication terminator protein [Melissococcus plutonius]MCV2505667.1 replication terminator protein [Melissococcus plutonius]